MRWGKRQVITKTSATSKTVNKLHLLEGYSLVQVGDALYVDGGHYFTGNDKGLQEPEIYALERNETVADQWVQLEDLYEFDLTRPMNKSTTADFLSDFCSTIKKSEPATRGWGGLTFADPINKDSFIHVGGVVEGGESQEPDNPFWGFNTRSGYTNDYKINDKKKAAEYFNMYDGTGAVSPDGKVWYLGGVDYSGKMPEGGARLAWYDMKSGDVGTVKANGGNLTVPSGANLRASSMVWLPYGEKGVLLNIGGVIWKDTQNVPNPMDRIMVYDIAGSRWYSQGTTAGNSNDGTPVERSHFCAVAPSPKKDRGSYEIIFYGGYNTDPGKKDDQKGLDDVWALTVPTFQWSKYYDFAGGPFGKYNRSCALINDFWYGFVDYALTDGGAILSYWDVTLGALDNGLDNGGWGRFDPEKKGYQTPLKVESLIQGVNSPPAGWAPGLSDIFNTTTFESKKPASANDSSLATTSSTPSPTATPSKSTTPIGPIVGGVLGGIAVLTGIALLIFFFVRRRRRQKQTSQYFNEQPIPPKPEAQTAELGGSGHGYSELDHGMNKGVAEVNNGRAVPSPERVELYGSVPYPGPRHTHETSAVSPQSPTSLGVPELHGGNRYSRSDPE